MKVLNLLFHTFLLCTILCGACHKETEPKAAVPVQHNYSSDSMQIIALTPTFDCLPFYWAVRHGLYEQMGLDIQIKTFASQFDCDSAILGQTAVGGATDLVRIEYYKHKKRNLEILTMTDNRWGLVVSRELRIKTADKLENRMVAVARFSASDYYSEKILKQNSLAYTDVFRPQINDLALRTTMLNENQINAAVLPEPFLTWARIEKHTILADSLNFGCKLNCFAINPTALKKSKDKDFSQKIIRGYNMAVDSLNKKGIASCRSILLNDYHLPEKVINAIHPTRFAHAQQPDAKSLEEARQFVLNH